MDVNDARSALLETLLRLTKKDESFSRIDAIRATAAKLGLQHYDGDKHALIFEAWHDLYRGGFVFSGENLNYPGQQWARLTARGLGSAASLSRDPVNPDGYRKAIAPYVAGQAVALSYLDEALTTYNRACFKASAVMIGAAAEALSLDLRDRLLARMTTRGVPVPPELTQWMIGAVLKKMNDLLKQRVQQLNKTPHEMPHDLRERFESHWPSWAGLLRMTRNEVGHPTSVEPVTHDLVHANLLLFHEHARLAHDLGHWVDNAF